MPRTLLLALLLCPLLGACGQKGPLYLPPPAAKPLPKPTAPASGSHDRERDNAPAS